MPRNIFKIYDGRNYFWQWDTNQKLIVLDDTVDEVHFFNKDMAHAIPKDVCIDKDGRRVCYVPDVLLTLPKNLVASAYVTDDNANKTVRLVKFAVRQRPIPSDYVVTEDYKFEDFDERLRLIEEIIADACLVQRFDTLEEAEEWAQESQEIGAIISVNVDYEWIAYVVKEDYSIVPICDCDEDALISAIESLQKLVGESAVADQIKDAIDALDLPNTYDAKDSAANALVDAKKYTDSRVQSYDEAVQNKLNEEIDRAKNEEAAITRAVGQVNDGLASAKKDIASNTNSINVLKGGENVQGSVANALAEAKLYADALAKNYDAAGSAEIVQKHLTEEIARAKNEEAALTRATQQINDQVTTAKADITVNSNSIKTLNGDVNVKGSVDYKIAQAIALIMDNPDDVINSINELINLVKESTFASSAIRKDIITLLADAWVEDGEHFSQVVHINGITKNSKVDLQPTPDLVGKLNDYESQLVAENNNGTIIVWLIGNKFDEDVVVQVTITEVIQE